MLSWATRTSYILLVLLQVIWHALLAEPMGTGSFLLALIATIPLLFPLKGILAAKLHSLTWGGYIVLFYLVVGIMEAWSNPAQRLPALIQTLLSVTFIVLLLLFSRQPRQ